MPHKIDLISRYKKFLWALSQVKLIPEFGWNDGGCLLLAKANEIWSEGELTITGVWKQTNPGQHVLQH